MSWRKEGGLKSRSRRRRNLAVSPTSGCQHLIKGHLVFAFNKGPMRDQRHTHGDTHTLERHTRRQQDDYKLPLSRCQPSGARLKQTAPYMHTHTHTCTALLLGIFHCLWLTRSNWLVNASGSVAALQHRTTMLGGPDLLKDPILLGGACHWCCSGLVITADVVVVALCCEVCL